jgi:hypothetical protein
VPFDLPLPEPWASQRWKAKIRDGERLEPPHVTIIQRTKAWRFNLRTGEFMDGEPPPGLVPEEVVAHVRAQIEALRRAWDERYPENPVRPQEEPDE